MPWSLSLMNKYFIFIFIPLFLSAAIDSSPKEEGNVTEEAEVKEEEKVEPKPKKECATKKITIYNDLALVESTHQFSLKKGENLLTISDFPKGAVEQSFLITNLEKELTFLQAHFEESETDKKFIISCISEEDSNQPFQLTYATEGIKWTPFYTAEFSYQYDTLHLNAWFVVNNDTNITFKGAALAFSSEVSHLSSEEKEIFNNSVLPYYHVPRCIDLPAKKSLQVNWVSRKNIPVVKEYRLNLAGDFLLDQTNKETSPKIELWITCRNGRKNLPNGPLVIYHRNKNNENYTLAKMILPNIRKKQDIAFKMPDFSINTKSLTSPVKVSYEQTEFQRFTGKLIETANRVILKNTSPALARIKVCIDLPCKDDIILRESIPHKYDDKTGYYWDLEIPANDKIDLRYRLRIAQP
jgi:hypothetical protein